MTTATTNAKHTHLTNVYYLFRFLFVVEWFSQESIDQDRNVERIGQSIILVVIAIRFDALIIDTPYVFISLFHTVIFVVVVVAVVGLRGENIWKSKVDRHSPVSSLLVVAKIGTGGTPERQERILFFFANVWQFVLLFT